MNIELAVSDSRECLSAKMILIVRFHRRFVKMLMSRAKETH